MTVTDLFSEITIRQMRARNRLMMAPMSQNSATRDGEATSWHMVHYGSRAVGGCGVVLMEDTAVTMEGRVSSHSLCLFEEHHAESLRPIVSFSQNNGAKVGIQLAHAGRKAWRDCRLDDVGRLSTGTEAFAPDWGSPKSLDVTGLASIAEAFVQSARLALDAGFDFIEIHAAHGYLIHQFLSPISNRRDDDYGKTAEGRLRLLVEITKAVRAVWPADRPIFCRLPAHDGHAEGLSVIDIMEIARVLGTLGIDVIDIAASNVDPKCSSITSDEMQHVSADIRSTLGLATITTGANDPNRAKDLLAHGKMDMIAVGRSLLINPYWLLSHANNEQRANLWPKQYTLAMPKSP